MIVFVAILAIIILSKIVIKGKKTVAREKNSSSSVETFLSQKSTTIINGIFVIVIFFSHSTQYFTMPENILDSFYLRFQSFHNQWVVTTFLAFSGFGVMSKMKSAGIHYMKSFPKNRLLKTLINYDVAVILYLIVNILLGIHYGMKTTILSFLGLASIGNSNWYIFTILLMYLISYIAARVYKEKYRAIVAMVTISAALYVVVAHLAGLPSRFVSTVMTYPLGMWIANNKSKIERCFKENVGLTLIVIAIPIIATYSLRGNDYFMNLNSCLFVLLVIWFMAHFEIRSMLLYLLGKHAFSIYILQRIPMVIISHYYSPSGLMRYLFVIVCLIITIGISMLFDKLLRLIDKKIQKI